MPKRSFAENTLINSYDKAVNYMDAELGEKLSKIDYLEMTPSELYWYALGLIKAFNTAGVITSQQREPLRTKYQCMIIGVDPLQKGPMSRAIENGKKQAQK